MGVLIQSEITDFTVSTSAYAALDAIGVEGPRVLPNVVRTTFRSGWLRQVRVYVSEAVTTGLSILLFESLPTGGTYTDNGALALSAADQEALIGIVPIVTADYAVTSGVFRVATVHPNRPIKVNATNLYFLVRTDQTPTFAAAGNIPKLSFIIERD